MSKQWKTPPVMQIDPEKKYIATMETSKGKQSRNCPTIIASWVNNRRQSPKGPARDNSIKRIRPTTTVGTAIRVCVRESRSHRPGKRQ